MSRLALSQLFQSVAAGVNQKAASPAVSSNEWNLYLEFMNRSYQEWSEAHDWEVLRTTFYPTITGTTQATLSLPLDFKKIATAPIFHAPGDYPEGIAWPEQLPEERLQNKINDKYFYITGNLSAGFNMIWHPGTLASGSSVEISYFSIPTSLATPTDIPLVPDSQFLIDRTIAYIFEARSDPRFQQQEARAREKLMQMIENADLSKYNSYSTPNPVQTGPLARMGFRTGRD